MHSAACDAGADGVAWAGKTLAPTSPMQQNLYHLLGFRPAVERWEMPPALEALAERIVASGKLRVNADRERNFVHHGGEDATFTVRELTDPALLPATCRRLARFVAPADGAHGVQALLARLQKDLKKARGVAPEKELRVARVLVQSAHPSVLHLLLQSGTELFVSYAHDVSDLMALQHWKTHGQASGLQATESLGTQVFVSCGGDPFFEGEQKTYTTDGFPALARMVVIAGQELGHFSDLRRSRTGQVIGRFSTDPMSSQLRASHEARTGRNADIARVAGLQARTKALGLSRLVRAEQSFAFYQKRWRFSPPWLLAGLWRLVWRGVFAVRTVQHGLARRLRVLPPMPHGAAYAAFLGDMAFNLAPDAEVYRNADPLVEEAIACIEALARVPQQVHKWGHGNVAFAWPHLYALYYETVIPACIAVSGEGGRTRTRPRLWQRGWIALRRACRKKAGYAP